MDAVRITKEKNLNLIISNQPVYNMLVRDIEKGVIPVSKEKGISQVVFSPLAQGVLTGKYKPNQKSPINSRAEKGHINYLMKSYLDDNVLRKVSALDNLASNAGIKLSQLAIAWVLRQPNISSAITGASSASQVEENVRAAEIKLTDGLFGEVTPILNEIERILPVWTDPM